MEVSYNQALTIRNEFTFLIGEPITMNNEKFTIKDITIVPADANQQAEFFKDHNILPFLAEKCEMAVILGNEHYTKHLPYLTLESLLKMLKIDFHLNDHTHAGYSLI
jgi:hypothetical protein